MRKCCLAYFWPFLNGVGKHFLSIFKIVCALSFNFYIYSACLAFLTVIWHLLPSDLAHLLHVNLEPLILFLWVLCDCIL